MKISEIKSKIITGDYKRIALMANCSESYVKAIFYGQRNPETPLAQKVITTARAYIKSIDHIKQKNQQALAAALTVDANPINS